MSNEIEGTISILAALLVLFTAMIDPVLAAGLAVFGLAAQGLTPGLADAIATISAPADYALVGWPRPQLVRHVAPRERLRPVARLLGFRLGALALPQPLDVVGSIEAPLLLIHGDTDRTVPVANAYALHRQAPQACLCIYAGIGHAVGPMRAQAPQRLLNDLRAHFAVLSR